MEFFGLGLHVDSLSEVHPDRAAFSEEATGSVMGGVRKSRRGEEHMNPVEPRHAGEPVRDLWREVASPMGQRR